MDTTRLEYNDIQKILPQRYPFVLIDRVVEFKKGESLVAIKNITANEWPLAASHKTQDTSHKSVDGSSRFTFHASLDIFPRTLMIESAAQAALILYQLSMAKEGEHPRFVLGRVQAEFFEDAHVGDEVTFKVGEGRMLKQGGYSDIGVSSARGILAQVRIFYSVSAGK